MAPMLDALAARSRLAVLRRLDLAPDSSAPELAKATGLNLNTVRTHLRALESSGIAERGEVRHGRRGRPTIRYRLREGVVPAGDELIPISSVLAGALARLGPKAEAACAEEGADWGRRWSRARLDEPPEARLRSALERLGFAVAISGGEMQLSQCPCPLVAAKGPALVCRLADAVADGVTEGTSLRLGSRRHDPEARLCSASLTND
jgi:predicted ArsR family transcriptional regulator